MILLNHNYNHILITCVIKVSINSLPMLSDNNCSFTNCLIDTVCASWYRITYLFFNSAVRLCLPSGTTLGGRGLIGARLDGAFCLHWSEVNKPPLFTLVTAVVMVVERWDDIEQVIGESPSSWTLNHRLCDVPLIFQREILVNNSSWCKCMLKLILNHLLPNRHLRPTTQIMAAFVTWIDRRGLTYVGKL